MDTHTSFEGSIQNALMQQRRVQPTDIGPNNAAMEGLGPYFRILLGLWDGERTKIKMFIQEVCLSA